MFQKKILYKKNIISSLENTRRIVNLLRLHQMEAGSSHLNPLVQVAGAASPFP